MNECMKRKTCDKAFRCGESVCRACKDRVEPGADADGDEEFEDREEDAGVTGPFEDDYGNSGSAIAEVPVTVEQTVTTKYSLKIRVAADSEGDARERACSVVDAMDADEVFDNGEVLSESPEWDSADSDGDVEVTEGNLEI